jgi:hypothetical protein
VNPRPAKSRTTRKASSSNTISMPPVEIVGHSSPSQNRTVANHKAIGGGRSGWSVGIGGAGACDAMFSEGLPG